jgi:hypothetical protein
VAPPGRAIRLFEDGFQQPGDVELNLGSYVGKLVHNGEEHE